MTRLWYAESLLAPWLVDSRLRGVCIRSIALDSRDVSAEGLFLAVAGHRAHGLDFLDQALEAGAVVVLYEPDPARHDQAILDQCQQAGAVAIPRAGLAALVSGIAGRFYGEPSRALQVVAVTGTDGKTSVAHYIAQLVEALHGSAAVMGTVGWGRPGDLAESTHTTADAVMVQARLAELHDAGIKTAVMEVSSHALAQHRVDAVAFETAVLTHVGRDHLDYHGSAEAYGAAKRRLFAWPTLRRQILNIDDAVGRDLASRPLCDAAVVTYGQAQPATLRLHSCESRAEGIDVAIDYEGQRYAEALPLIGRFNAINAIAALGAVIDDANAQAAIEAIAGLQPVPGRMERFAAAGSPLVVVDYAHTAGALSAALEALRAHVAGRLWVVFGCGGDRDPGKRPLMGATADRLADVVILTSDNPRTESPRAIIEAVRVGCSEPGRCRVIEDRAAAITAAVNEAGSTDGVLIAGKGHETRQWIGTSSQTFSDREIAAGLLSQRAG